MIRLPRISNFTDFSPFERYANVSLRYISSVGELGTPDMILLPGTKSTIADLSWLRQSGLEAAICKEAARARPSSASAAAIRCWAAAFRIRTAWRPRA